MATIREDIVDWINHQSYWVRFASEKLLRGFALEDIDIDLLVGLIKSETNDDIDFSFFNGLEVKPSVIKLKSIGNIKGIDELKPKKPLEFSDGLNVIYGHNGSGKTGYTRILKKASGSTTAIELKNNVFDTDETEQGCDFVININDEDHLVEWKSAEGSFKFLEGMDIFDSFVGGVYLNKESGLSYLPLEVAFFEKLVQVFQNVKKVLEDEKNKLTSNLPSKPEGFSKDNSIVQLIYSDLSSATDIEELKQKILLTDEDVANKKQLEERLNGDPEKLIQKKNQTKEQLKLIVDDLTDAVKQVSREECERIVGLSEKVMHARQQSREAADILEEKSELSGIGSETWKLLWKSARNYSISEAYKDNSYPNLQESSLCVLCQQTLSDDAKLRLSSFESYIRGELEEGLKEVEDEYALALDNLPSVLDESTLATALEASQLEQDQWLEPLKQKWKEVHDIIHSLKENNLPIEVGYPDLAGMFDPLYERIEQLEKEISQHEQDRECFNINDIKSRLGEIKSKEWVNGFLENIEDEVNRLIQLDCYDAWIRVTHTRRITHKSGEVSEHIITEAFIERFNHELSTLTYGKRPIKVELIKTRMSDGKAQHGIQLSGFNPLSGDFKTSDILSEGEQRIVALAAFLADVSENPFSAPFVFDDPISSLDQQYEENTAQRLIELSNDRQVIILTHRLSLVGILIKDLKEDQIKAINREHWGVGEQGELPMFAKQPIRALKNLDNDRVSKAIKLYENEGVDVYGPFARSVLSDLRILLERIVETEFLAGVIQRHSREVQTKNKIFKLAKINEDDCQLIDGMMTELSRFEHSQSGDLPVEVPGPEYLREKISTILTWHAEFSTRK